jgi:hypothetical protein
MKFAKIVFRIAGIWGFLIITPLYFMFDVIPQRDPPAITHPAFYYGFVGVTLVWQLAFLIIASDPVRFRPLMVAGIFEKLVYIIPTTILVIQKRTNSNELIFVATDSLLCILFVLAYLRTPERS